MRRRLNCVFFLYLTGSFVRTGLTVLLPLYLPKDQVIPGALYTLCGFTDQKTHRGGLGLSGGDR